MRGELATDYWVQPAFICLQAAFPVDVLTDDLGDSLCVGSRSLRARR